MKRLIALLTAFCLVAGPALAGITPLTGTTNALLSTGTEASSVNVTLTSAATTVDAPIGTFFVIAVTQRTASTITSCGDSVNGSVYSLAGSAVVNGAAVEWLYYYQTTVDVPIGTTFSCTFPSASNGKSMIIAGFTAMATSSQADGTPTTGTGTWTSGSPFTIGPTGTLACNTSAGEIVIAGTALASNVTWTEDAAFSHVSSQTANAFEQLAYKIVNANTAVSYSPTATATAAAYAGELQGFKAATCAAAAINHGLLLTGVGQ